VAIRPLARFVAAALLASVMLTLAACGGVDVTFVSEGASYTLEQVDQVHAAQRPPASVRGRPVAEATGLRRDALVELRSRGGEAAELAEFITRTIADSGRSVPYYGEAASVDGMDCWIILEVWGPESSTLENTRLWVFTRDAGTVIYSSTNR